MAAAPFSAATLLAISARLSTKAKSAAYDIDDLIRDREDEIIKTTIDRLCLLSTSLNQLSHHANQVEELLRQSTADSVIFTPVLAGKLFKLLPECERALAFVSKQLARLDRDTPSQRIDATAIGRFEHAVTSTAALCLILQQLLSVATPEDQQTQLNGTECQQNFDAASVAAKECRRSEILAEDVGGGRTATATSTAKLTTHEDNRNGLPAYSPSTSSSTQARDNSTQPPGPDEDAQNITANFFTSLAKPFKALSVAMKPKPEPLVVPLCEAATRGDIQHIKGLVSEGANIDGYNESGLTPLICAIRANQLDSMRTLLDAGASRSRPSSGGSGSGNKPPLWHAVDHDSENALDVLLQNGASMADGDGWFLELVQGRTSAEWIGRLLARGASAHARDTSGRTAVVLALERRKKKDDSDDVVKILLAHGADANARDLYGTPLIHLCLQQERGELMRYLLDRGASVNCGDIYGNTLLVEVVKRKNFELAKMLVMRGADVNGSDYTGKPVVLIVMTDDKLSTAMKLEMLEPLCKRGARCGVVDSWGVTALDHAFSNFTKGEPGGPRPLSSAELRIVELLLTNGANADQKLTKQTGYPTLLTFAIERQDWELARMALTKGTGAKPNHADAKGRTPLLMAMLSRRMDIAGLLLQKGADVNLAGTISPMELAVSLQDEGVLRLFGLPPGRTEGSDSTASANTTMPTEISHDGEDAPPQYAAL